MTLALTPARSLATHRRIPARRTVAHHETLIALKRELDAASPHGPATVYSRSRPSWPAAGRIHEVAVVLGAVRARAEHRDPEVAALRAFQQVFDALSPVRCA